MLCNTWKLDDFQERRALFVPFRFQRGSLLELVWEFVLVLGAVICSPYKYSLDCSNVCSRKALLGLPEAPLALQPLRGRTKHFW